MTVPDPPSSETLLRWRYVLGRFAQPQLPCSRTESQQRMEQALDFLYGKEYTGRGIRESSPTAPKQPGTLDPSQMSVPEWIQTVRELFPQETLEVIEKHALERYGLKELVTDPQVLEHLQPNLDLLKTILTFKGQMQGEVLHTARRLVRQIIEEIRQRLEPAVRQTLRGKLNRFHHSPVQVAQNLDWRGTLRQNLKYYDPAQHRLLIQQVRFFSRIERRLPWHVILCIDQSGSMVGSVIHSAVLGGILAGLPTLTVSFVVFDTSVVDLSGYVEDPVEVLMSVQLGGGTDIGQALTYCEGLIHNPHRTVLVLISDFAEGASPQVMLVTSRRLREAGVKLLGLASLDESAQPFYDRHMAEQLADTGMEIAALTPQNFAAWLAQVINH